MIIRSRELSSYEDLVSYLNPALQLSSSDRGRTYVLCRRAAKSSIMKHDSCRKEQQKTIQRLVPKQGRLAPQVAGNPQTCVVVRLNRGRSLLQREKDFPRTPPRKKILVGVFQFFSSHTTSCSAGGPISSPPRHQRKISIPPPNIFSHLISSSPPSLDRGFSPFCSSIPQFLCIARGRP